MVTKLGCSNTTERAESENRTEQGLDKTTNRAGKASGKSTESEERLLRPRNVKIMLGFDDF